MPRKMKIALLDREARLKIPFFCHNNILRRHRHCKALFPPPPSLPDGWMNSTHLTYPSLPTVKPVALLLLPLKIWSYRTSIGH